MMGVHVTLWRDTTVVQGVGRCGFAERLAVLSRCVDSILSMQVSALRRQLVDSSQFPKATAAASGSKAAGGGSQALRGQSGAAANSGSSTQESAAPHDGFKATSVLVGELGKAPPWEVVKAEEDRKRREQVRVGGRVEPSVSPSHGS
jgi:hypothetical protein